MNTSTPKKAAAVKDDPRDLVRLLDEDLRARLYVPDAQTELHAFWFDPDVDPNTSWGGELDVGDRPEDVEALIVDLGDSSPDAPEDESQAAPPSEKTEA